MIESVLTGTLQELVPDRYRAGALGLGDTVMVGACLVGSLVTPTAAMLVAVPVLAGLHRRRDAESLDADELPVLRDDRQLA